MTENDRDEMVVHLLAICIEFEHALREVTDCSLDACPECVKVAKSALDRLNKKMCLEIAREEIASNTFPYDDLPLWDRTDQ